MINLPGVRVIEPATPGQRDDAQFWRDAEAAERMIDPDARKSFIEELVRVEAYRRMDGQRSTPAALDHHKQIERDLMRQCQWRGYCD